MHSAAVGGPVDLLVTLDGSDNLGEQVYRKIRDAIVEGRVPAGVMLPSTRDMAARLSVSRTTIAKAYERLSAEGFIRSRSGRGSYVDDRAGWGRVHRPRESPLRPRPVWQAVSEPADMSAVSAGFDFRSGIPDASQFPFSTWRSLIGRQLRQSAVGTATHIGASGHHGLRRAIGRHIGVSRGVRATPGEILVTSGSQQAIDIVGRVLIEPGDVVAVEDPGYLPPFRAFTALGARVVGVPVDEEGLIVDALPAEARLVYVCSAHQYPLGMTMSVSRRLAILEWAERAGAAIIEDDYDGEFRYGGRPLEPLHTLDPAGRVIYVGSFSKVMLPTLRLGFLVAPESLQPALRKAKHVADWHTEVPLQAAMSEFIERGLLDRHVRRMRGIYAARHHAVRSALSKHLADWLVPLPSAAGMHLAALLTDQGLDDVALSRRAAASGVAVQPLTYFAHSAPARAGLVIGYGAISLNLIDEGMRRLRACLDENVTASGRPR